MGWTYTHKETGLSTKDFFAREWPSLEIVASGGAKGEPNTHYFAVLHREQPAVVFAIVVLLNRRPKDFFNFGYKDMDETMGPNDDHCPKKVFDALTPLDPQVDPSGYAADWRARVQKWLETGGLKLKNGLCLRAAEPVRFTDNTHYQHFECVNPRRRHFTAFCALPTGELIPRGTIRLTNRFLNNFQGETWDTLQEMRAVTVEKGNAIA